MTDSTWKTACPACGAQVSTNQLGQKYAHRGVCGCPYSGNGPITRQGVYPLKFSPLQIITVTAAYMDDGLGAAVEYEPEYDIEPDEFLSLRTMGDETFGIARVDAVHEGSVTEAFRIIRDSHARRNHDTSGELVEALDGHYEADLDHDSEVALYIYEPHIPSVYRDKPPVFDRL